MSVEPIGAWQLGIAAGLVAVSAALSWLLRLRLEKQLAIGAARTVIQLLLVGYVLEYVFAARSFWLIFATALVMAGFATHASAARSNHAYRGLTAQTFLTLAITSFAVSSLVTKVVVQVHPWYKPQYLIPLLGMILGNSLTGLSISADTLFATVTERRPIIEMELAHGASGWEAVLDPLRSAVRLGMTPTINAMMVVGVVSLPGMMTGQILAGNSPVEAVRYQIVVMFMLTAASAVSCVSIVLLAYRRLFNKAQQLTQIATTTPL